MAITTNINPLSVSFICMKLGISHIYTMKDAPPHVNKERVFKERMAEEFLLGGHVETIHLTTSQEPLRFLVRDDHAMLIGGDE